MKQSSKDYTNHDNRDSDDSYDDSHDSHDSHDDSHDSHDSYDDSHDSHDSQDSHDRRNRMSELRKKRGLTQKQVAEALGIGESSYCNYENSVREPSYQLLAKIADFFDVSIDYLLFHQIPGTDFTLSPDDIEILKTYYAIEPPARDLVNRQMELARDYEARIPRPPEITVSFGVDPGADPEADPGKCIIRVASRDGDGIREESVTQEQLRMLQELDPLDDDI